MTFQPIPFTPKRPELQQHISYYYFLKTDTNFDTRYFAFPHTNTVLNIHQKANFEIRDLYTRVYADTNTEYAACVQGIRENPLLAHLHGRLNKVTILFKPLGINQFGIPDFGSVYKTPSEIFSSWDASPPYQNFLRSFYSTDNMDKRRDILEDFLATMYSPVADHEWLFKAISFLDDFNENLSIEQISNMLNVNVRTLNRAFKKYLGVSPISYRKVARFRHSLQNKLFDAGLKRLTDIAYQSNYYDQAYFNKIFRSLTGTNPQRFFGKVNSLADDRLILEFMEQ